MSATTNTEKTSITLTLEPEQKQLLEKAAGLTGFTTGYLAIPTQDIEALE